MSQFVAGSDFGGPSVPDEYRTELTRIVEQMEGVPLDYLIEAMMYFGGEFLEITEPTGMYKPRISAPKKTANFVIYFNNRDVMSASDPRRFLRKTLHTALSDLFGKIATKDKSVNAATEMEKIAFLLD